MITAEDIKMMARRGESYNVDFKVTVPQKVRDITQEVCSFANAAGGYVLIGIDDNGSIKGVNLDNAKRSSIQNSIGEISPALHCELYPVEVDGKEVWVIDVPAGRLVPYYDSIPQKKYDIFDHLDNNIIKIFRREAHISNNVDDKQLLVNLQAFTENEEVKRGAILFFDSHPEELFFHAVV